MDYPDIGSLAERLNPTTPMQTITSWVMTIGLLLIGIRFWNQVRR